MSVPAENNSYLASRFMHTVLPFCLLVTFAACGSKRVTHILKYEAGPTVAGPVDDEDLDSVLIVVNGRLRGAGRATKIGPRQISVEVYGDVDKPQLDLVKQRITTKGGIEFRVLASPYDTQDKPIVELAKKLAPVDKSVTRFGKTVAEWVRCDDQEFEPDRVDDRMVMRRIGEEHEALLLHGVTDITGEYLEAVNQGLDEQGNPALNFSLSAAGAVRMQRLTRGNLPNPATGELRYLGVVFDGRLIVAPSIVATIGRHGQISGRHLSASEFEVMVAVLEEGILPVPLRQISEQKSAP